MYAVASLLVTYFLTVSTTYAAETRVEKIVERLKGVAAGSSTFVVEYKEHQFPIEVEGDDDFILTVRTPEGKLCFEFMAVDDVGTLEKINTSHSSCPLPTDKKGTYLLGLADFLAEEAGLSSIELIDAATIECPRSHSRTSLSFLRLMQKGSGWYQDHGYKPPSKLQAPYASASDALKSFSLKELEQKFPEMVAELENRPSVQRNLQIRSSHSDVLALLQTRLQQFKSQTSSDRLDQFLSWIWHENCAEYVTLEKLIFSGDERSARKFSWIKLRADLDKQGSKLQKNFKVF